LPVLRSYYPLAPIACLKVLLSIARLKVLLPIVRLKVSVSSIWETPTCDRNLFVYNLCGQPISRLRSFDEKNLAILKIQSTDAKEKAQAARVCELIKDHHLLLVTLLLWNAAAFESLPIFIDRLVPTAVAIVISVTFILIFGEIVPQAICTGPRKALSRSRALSLCAPLSASLSLSLSHPSLSRLALRVSLHDTPLGTFPPRHTMLIAPHGSPSHTGRLQVAAASYWFIKFLMFVSWPISVGFARTLDYILGTRHDRNSSFMYVEPETIGMPPGSAMVRGA
jgi:hypothetical protein